MCFHLYLLFELKKNFEQKGFGKEFLHGQNKEKVFIKPTLSRRLNRVQRGLLKILFLLSFLFLIKHGFCSILFTKRKYIVLNVRNWRKKRFSVLRNLWAFKERKPSTLWVWLRLFKSWENIRAFHCPYNLLKLEALL